jgi:hypothetical protein
MISADRDLMRIASNYLAARRVWDALRIYHIAEALHYPAAECAAGRWMCWMLVGEFELAWRESDAIEAIGGRDPNRFWDGNAFDGKSVLLRTLHGLGDAVQFIRYAPLIRRHAHRLIVQTHPELVPLFKHVDGIDEVTTWPDSVCGHTKWNQQIECMELPRAFRTVIESIPARVPYISIDRAAIDCRKGQLGGHQKPRIGLLWAASTYDASRSMCLSTLGPLLALNQFQFYSFQRGPERDQLNEFPDHLGIYDTAEHSPSILDTAADLANMVLLISVDTFVAHLAGALGCQVWLMLPYASDWRWMVDRSDSPWYPTMRLFRQTRIGDWRSVVSSICCALEKTYL